MIDGFSIDNIETFTLTFEGGALIATKKGVIGSAAAASQKYIFKNIESYNFSYKNGSIIAKLNAEVAPAPAPTFASVVTPTPTPVVAPSPVAPAPTPAPAPMQTNRVSIIERNPDKYSLITESDLFGKDLKGSKPICIHIYGNKPENIRFYSNLLEYVYSRMSKHDILRYTTLGISTEEQTSSHLMEQHGLYIPYVTSIRSLKELVHIARKMRLSFILKLQMHNGEIIHFAM